MATRSERVESAQNESKRAVVNAVAAEIESVDKTLVRSSEDLMALAAQMSVSWEGEASASLFQTMADLSESLKLNAANAKSVASRIRNAAKEAYP
ncbi:MAG: hypothetical protein LBC41_09770 [Clostridiales bacterium]|jgi:hypothetical protein|nr:hypothetical protein [Clostridiales bacterium]